MVNIDPWSEPKRISVEEVGDSIEMVFKQYNRSIYDSWYKPLPEDRVFKIINERENPRVFSPWDEREFNMVNSKICFVNL
jgi:hypothetical protein